MAVPNRASSSLWSGSRSKAHLSRADIVRAALQLADRDGLDGVSIRNVATQLGTRPMTLYSHVRSKDDLVALMLNEASIDFVAPRPLPRDWREALQLIAQHAFRAYVRHPWMLQALSRGAPAGPNLLRRAEQLASVVNEFGLDPAEAWSIGCIVQEWVMGHAMHVIKLNEERDFADHLGISPRDEFPAAREIFNSYLETSPDGLFERSLNVVLDGIERRVGRRRST